MAEPNGPLVKFAFTLLGITLVFAVAAYALAIFFGLIAVFPLGILGFIPLVAVLILLWVIVRDQSNRKEDKYYSDNVDQ